MKEEDNKEFDLEKLKKLLELAELFGNESKTDKLFPNDFDVEEIKKALMAEKKINIYGELLNWAVREKYKILSSISALSATLLIIATFNQNLIELTGFVRILLVILLSLATVSIWALLYELYKAETHGLDQLKSIMVELNKPDAIRKFDKFRDITFRGTIPWIIVGLFSVVVIIIIILILEKI